MMVLDTAAEGMEAMMVIEAGEAATVDMVEVTMIEGITKTVRMMVVVTAEEEVAVEVVMIDGKTIEIWKEVVVVIIEDAKTYL